MKAAHLFAAGVMVTCGALATPASASDWSWLSNKDYVACLRLYASGNFLMPAGSSPAQQAALHEKGRRYCNRTYYGHD